MFRIPNPDDARLSFVPRRSPLKIKIKIKINAKGGRADGERDEKRR